MGRFGKRIVLFLVTNLAVIVLLGVVLRVLGIDGLAFAGGYVDWRALLVLSAVIGFGGAFISLALSKWMARLLTRARVIDQPRTAEEHELVEVVGRLARAAGVEMPEVAIYPSRDPNAFATGARRNRSMVAVSAGLFEAMGPAEREAVLAHEITHVANGDMVTLTLVQGVLNTFVIFLSRIVGFAVDRAVFRNERGYGIGYWVSVIASEILLGLLATIVVMWFSRRREFAADAGAARLVGPRPMADALRSLGRYQAVPAALPQSLDAFGIRGGKAGVIGGLFRSHPPLEARIAALESMDAGRTV